MGSEKVGLQIEVAIEYVGATKPAWSGRRRTTGSFPRGSWHLAPWT